MSTTTHETLLQPDNGIEEPSGRIIHGDCLIELKKLPDNSVDAVVTDPPYGLGEVKDIAGLLMAWIQDEDDAKYLGKSGLSTSPLNSGIRFTVAWFAKCYKVIQPVSFFIAFNAEKPERFFMVYMLTIFTAMLTGVFIPFQCLASLCLPVWPSIIARSAKPLRMFCACSMFISAYARAVLTHTYFVFKRREIKSKGFIAIQANERFCLCFSGARFYSGVLTSRRTMLSSTVFLSRQFQIKDFTAILARMLLCLPVCICHASPRAVTPTRYMRWLAWKRFFAISTNYFYHVFIVAQNMGYVNTRLTSRFLQGGNS